MNRTIFVYFAVLIAVASFPTNASAQKYLGDLPRGGEKPEVQKDKAAKPVTKVFSSKVMSTTQAEKLDVLYNNLSVSLWNYAITDFRYQKKLFSLMESKRFKTTRYSKEFSRDLDAALKNLNKNHSDLMSEITKAEDEYVFVREAIRSIDYEILDPLWRKKMDEFETRANTYFKMQHAFLKTYRNLVAFILKQGGSYYYKTDTQRVHFYRFEGYKFFGKSLDRLNKISYEQRKFLRENPPANIDLDSVK